ncbi:MAG: N-acetylmuramoyl-L-alanine amidase family protein [Defluviitaleaceae bacterium]|nr:N-acetylmuramoyl-L-alanine amidase family protein [Defluviitaleaceae bacterium]
MKKLVTILILAAVFLMPSFAYANGDIRLVIDGSEMQNLSTPPIIVGERTLVPARDVFERVGGIVGWHSGHRQVSLFFGDDVIVLTIDERTAQLNGNLIQMDVPPIIYNDSTMIPLRFPAEVFGFDVDWLAEESIAIVNSPGNGNGNGNNGNGDSLGDISDIPIISLPPVEEPEIPLPPADDVLSESNKEELPWDGTADSDELPPPGAAVLQGSGALARDVSTSAIVTVAHPQTTITALRTPAETGTAAFVAVATLPISEVQYFLLPDNRLVVDIHNAVSMISGDFTATANVPVNGVRAAQFSQEPRVTRIVFEVVGAAEYSITLSADRMLLTVSFSQNRITGVFAQSDANTVSDSLFIQGDVLPAINISTEGFPHFLTINIDNADMTAVGGAFNGGNFASHFSTGQRADGSAYVRVYVHGDWPSFSTAHSDNSVALVLHRGVSGVRYDSVNRELRISRQFSMDISQVQQINEYLRLQHTFVLPPQAHVLGRGEISLLDGFVNSVSLTPDVFGNIHLTFNTARVLNFSIHEEAEYFVIRAHLPRDVSPFIVVIDPGHGGSDPGTHHNGILEKDFVLMLSHKVMQLLDADPFIQAFMTRRDDTFVSLLNRAEFANDLDADLFISVHLNAAEKSPGVINPAVHGIETWYANAESRSLANIMQRQKIQHTNAHSRGLRSGPNLVVLREANMPAVLLELGFITSPDEAARLLGTQYQWQLAHAIYRGIAEALGVA